MSGYTLKLALVDNLKKYIYTFRMFIKICNDV